MEDDEGIFFVPNGSNDQWGNPLGRLVGFSNPAVPEVHLMSYSDVTYFAGSKSIHADTYDVDSDQLILDQMQLAGSRTRIRGEARVSDVSRILRAAPNEPAAFNIAFPSMTLDVPGTFTAPLNLANVQVIGAVVSADRAISFSRLHAETGDGIIEGAGRYYWGEAGADRALRPGFQLDASIGGTLSVGQVIALWPMTLASGTHAYLDHTLTGGTVSDVHAHLDIRPTDTLGGPMRNDAINVEGRAT